MLALYKKDLGRYLNNLTGYLSIGLFSMIISFLFVKDIFIVGSVSLIPLFDLLVWGLAVFTPVLSMSSFSDEKKDNTLEVLLSLPVSEAQIVASKVLSIFTLLIITLFLTLSLPISISFLTHDVYIPEVLVGYLGVILAGLAFVSVSVFISSITENRVLSFIASLVILMSLLLMGSDFFASFAPRSLQGVLNSISPVYYYRMFSRGVIELKAVLYFIAMTVVFIFMTVVELEKRN